MAASDQQDQETSEEIEDLEPVIEESEPDEIDFLEDVPPQVLKERTASQVAAWLIRGYLLLLAFPFVYLVIVAIVSGGTVASMQVASVVDMIKTVAAVLGGVVGVIGTYYFMQSK